MSATECAQCQTAATPCCHLPLLPMLTLLCSVLVCSVVPCTGWAAWHRHRYCRKVAAFASTPNRSQALGGTDISVRIPFFLRHAQASQASQVEGSTAGQWALGRWAESPGRLQVPGPAHLARYVPFCSLSLLAVPRLPRSSPFLSRCLSQFPSGLPFFLQTGAGHWIEVFAVV